MEVENVAVDFKHGYGNSPELEVQVDNIPDRSEIIYQSTDNRKLWYGETDGYANFFAGHPDNPGDGYGSRKFTLQTENGEVVLTGPYSSRAGVINMKGFGPVVGVKLTDDPDVIDRGYTFLSGSITLEKAQEAVDMVEGLTLEKTVKFSNNEPYWIPQTEDGYVSAVDNSIVGFKTNLTGSDPTELSPDTQDDISLQSDEYAVCVDTYEYSNRDWWVVPVSRDGDGSVTSVNNHTFALTNDGVIQQTSSLV